MGVLAFGDSSTWALQHDGSTTGALATAKARRAARFGDGTVPDLAKPMARTGRVEPA